ATAIRSPAPCCATPSTGSSRASRSPSPTARAWAAASSGSLATSRPGSSPPAEGGTVELTGRTVLVTGGGSGLGAATARMVVEAGGSAVVAGVDAGGGRRIAAELGERARFVATDVTDEDAPRAAVAAAVELGGGLRVAVSCAGIAPAERVLGRQGPHSLARFVAAIQVNLVGNFNVTRLAAEAMAGNEPLADGERGVIVHTASVAAFHGQIRPAAYAARHAG